MKLFQNELALSFAHTANGYFQQAGNGAGELYRKYIDEATWAENISRADCRERLQKMRGAKT
jgi:hypothetical protein